MGEFTSSRLADFVLCPRASQIAVQAVTTSAAALDLRTVGPQTAKQDSGPTAIGATNTYVTLQADGGDVYVAFGATSGAVTGIVPATNAVNGASGCAKVPNGTSINVIPENPADVFVGYVTASGTAQLRVWISSVR
jgi:hypothetical protein